MARLRLPGFRALLIWALATALVLLVGGFLFATSGLYNIAAREPHWPIVRWFLEYSMRRSVETQTLLSETAPPPEWRAGEDAVRLGAAHFQSGCAFCHGAPGDRSRPVARSMRPAPPDLGRATLDWSTDQLFWIVHNGFKYTGMPHWPAKQRRDEVWPVVAFLQRLPELDAAGYRNLAFGNRAEEGGAGRSGGADEDEPGAVATCAACHGDSRSGPTSALVPRLDLLKPAVIEVALRQYAEGSRASGIMEPVVARLQPEELPQLARYYAGLDPARLASTAVPAAAPREPERLERGRRLATEGDPQSFLPACSTCHFEGSNEIFPRLAGQSAAYIAGQLRLWQHGGRSATPTGELMAVIAGRLSEEQVEDVAAYYGSLPPTRGARP